MDRYENSAWKAISGHFHRCRSRVAECSTDSFISSCVHAHRLSPFIRSVSILISKHLQSTSASLPPLTSNWTELAGGKVFSFRPSRELMTTVEQCLANMKQKFFKLNDVFWVCFLNPKFVVKKKKKAKNMKKIVFSLTNLVKCFDLWKNQTEWAPGFLPTPSWGFRSEVFLVADLRRSDGHLGVLAAPLVCTHAAEPC